MDELQLKMRADENSLAGVMTSSTPRRRATLSAGTKINLG
jgi:hypothetical protein